MDLSLILTKGAYGEADGAKGPVPGLPIGSNENAVGKAPTGRYFGPVPAGVGCWNGVSVPWWEGKLTCPWGSLAGGEDKIARSAGGGWRSGADYPAYPERDGVFGGLLRGGHDREARGVLIPGQPSVVSVASERMTVLYPGHPMTKA
jgi:hypothetical protein